MSAEEIDLADLITITAWAAERGEIPYANEWVDSLVDQTPIDPMAHII